MKWTTSLNNLQERGRKEKDREGEREREKEKIPYRSRADQEGVFLQGSVCLDIVQCICVTNVYFCMCYSRRNLFMSNELLSIFSLYIYILIININNFNTLLLHVIFFHIRPWSLEHWEWYLNRNANKYLNAVC